MSGPLVEAIGESIRVRRCAPRSGRWGNALGGRSLAVVGGDSFAVGYYWRASHGDSGRAQAPVLPDGTPHIPHGAYLDRERAVFDTGSFVSEIESGERRWGMGSSSGRWRRR